MLKTIFFGNSSFSIPTLEILGQKTQLCAVVTGLDHWITRHQRTLVEPLPKIYAKNRQIPCLQPEKLKTDAFLETIQSYSPELIVVISYGKILPREVFEIPTMGTFNLHASLLPKYRGASPIQESLLNNDDQTGITLQKINEYMDDGDIYGETPTQILPSMRYPQLQSLLSLDAAKTLEPFLDFIQKTGKPPESQKQVGEISFCTKISKDAGRVSFCEHSAQEIFNKFRAYYSWPQIFTSFREMSVKLEEIQLISPVSLESPPGTVLQADSSALTIQANPGILSLQKLKAPNRKSLDFSSFLNGYQIKQGDLLC